MPTLYIFDKPMCCSSGVCGPEVDSALVTLAGDLRWLERQGVQVQRINPAHQPDRFAASELVRVELKKHGDECLPLFVVNSSVLSRGVIPTRRQLADWTGAKPDSLPELPVRNAGCCGDS